jgi:hypothetical protein
VLAFAGAKMLLGKWGVEIAPLISVGLIVVTIGAAVVASLIARRRRRVDTGGQPGGPVAASRSVPASFEP